MKPLQFENVTSPFWTVQLALRLILQDLNTEMLIFAAIPKMVIEASGEGRVTCSELNCLICIQIHFLKRFWIWTGKFEIPTVTPNMTRSVKIEKYDQLYLGWSNLYLDFFFEKI